MNLKKIKDAAFLSELVLWKGESLDTNKTRLNRNLKSVDMSDSDITVIPDYAFHGCSNLGRVILPKNIQQIGTCAFYGCTNLRAIEFPGSLKGISAFAFAQCESITSVKFPSSVESVSIRAFENCSLLKTVTVESLETIIDESAFNGCSRLKSINTSKGSVSMEEVKHAIDPDEGIISWDLLESE